MSDTHSYGHDVPRPRARVIGPFLVRGIEASDPTAEPERWDLSAVAAVEIGRGDGKIQSSNSTLVCSLQHLPQRLSLIRRVRYRQPRVRRSTPAPSRG